MSADDKTRILTDVGTATVGTQLSGIYELDKRIASGGMGEVYRGHNIQTGDHVAIKIVLPEYAHNQTILALVRKEASILNRLSHDAIVRYHVFTVDPGIGRPYLAMEFVDGESLLDVMEHGPMSTVDAGKLCYRLASGLSAVHEAGAVHRDLSPDNIILPGGKVERAKIIDFGIARSATIGGETLIGGSFAGKYNYVSPEQLGLYGGDVREASDIYSLGLVLAAAMRGRPIEMGGSQLEVLEKRRIVPDLSDIDVDFRPIIEAMLQPDPANRPASMAEIAGVMRDGPLLDADRPMVAHSATPRDHRTALPPAGQSPFRQGSASPFASNFQGSPTDPTTSSSAAGDPDFFPYVPPAHLSHPRPAMDAAFQAAPPTRPSNRRNIALAATASVVVAVGAAAYFGGLLTPRDQQPAANTGETPPPAEAAGERVADAAAGDDRPAENVAPAVTEASAPATPPANRMQDTAKDQAVPVVGEVADADAATAPKAAPVPVVAQPAQADTPATTPHVESANSEPQLAVPAPSAGQQDIASDGQPAAAAEPATAVPEATAVAPLSATPPADQPEHPSEPDSPTAPAVDKAGNSGAATVIDAPPIPVVIQPKPADQPPAAVAQPDAEPAKPAPQPMKSAPPAQLQETVAADGPTPQTSTTEKTGETGETVVAMNVPPPSATASDSIDTVADRISWLHDYRGGDCFYATMTSATDKTIEIEGFGTAVAPFEQMLQAFQAKFHVEPDVSVRLIEPAQCEITNFLRALGATSANRPTLALDRTSVPNDTTISGTLETRGGLRTSLLLIDNKGMAFSLDERVAVQSGKATFNIPISLGAADQADGKPLPQIIVAVTGGVDLSAAAFSKPTAATVVLPKILAEIQAKGLKFAATAKYFRLGG